MRTAAVDAQPDTQDMVVIHRIFRRGFPMLAELARGVPERDTAWAASLGAHVDFLLNGLHHHHTAEDDHLWPRLLERTRPDGELVARMEQQHKVVAGHVEHVRRVLPGWRADPSGAELPDALDELALALAQHLDEEEAEILPLIRTHITVAEWQQLGDEAFAKFTDDEKLIALGQLLDVTSPDEAALFLGELPLFVRLMWALSGRRRYRRYMEKVSGADRRRGR